MAVRADAAELKSQQPSALPAPALGSWQHVPFWVWLATGVLASTSVLTANPALTAFSLGLLPVFAQLLWRRGEPPVLFFACGMQWLQASLVIFYGNWAGLSLTAAFGGGELERATWLSLIGVLVLAFGMRIALLRANKSMGPLARQQIMTFSPPKLFNLYLVAFVGFYALGSVAFTVPRITQPLMAAMNLKWVLVCLLAYTVLEQRRHYGLLAVAVVLEFTLGLLGFFSTFKTVFLVLLVVVLTATSAVDGRRFMLAVLVAVALFTSGVAWTVVKADYRDFLNQGTGEQEEYAPVDQRLQKLAELTGSLTWQSFAPAVENVVLRMSYVHYFALTIMNVPSKVPHENGALWFDAIKRVVTPRLLFPSKSEIQDSLRTEKYTGEKVAGSEQGTSISLGYFAESYIDFGPVYMFVPIFLLGAFFGSIYRWFVIHGRFKALGFALATAVLVFGAFRVETSNVKIVGGSVMTVIVFSLFSYAVGPPFLRWVSESARPIRLRRRGRTL
jgi:hypothetical protein